MSDRMIPIPFPDLMNRILTEHAAGTVFGVARPYIADASKRLPLFSEFIEMPFGPAAGPHTQLAQNIVAAYYAGSRFFELKTVQTLDGEDLSVSKPCILAADEGCNVEWSTELRVSEAFDEYVKAWFILKLISREFGLGSPDGFVFNMSVGYHYEGICSEKIDRFIEGLKNAADTPVFRDCVAWTRANLSRFSHIDNAYIDTISPHVCTSITLSTLHGCPPQEIERIASHLISVKRLNTFVKCNPTLLGYDFARRTLDGLGYDALSFTDFHFRDDLQYRDAIPMFRRLTALADENGVSFGLKLTNTFPVNITRGELPGTEMYLSGRVLYPLTIELAHRIAKAFDGKMRISFSGGADIGNIAELFNAGIWPVTMATTILKPGGYQRLTQIAEKLSREPFADFDGVSVGRVGKLARLARTGDDCRKPIKPRPDRKRPDRVPLLNCFTAPCTHGCPIGQDIPEYVRLVGMGRYAEALTLILEKNPLPFITGKICSHRCMERCTRVFYDESVHIRDAKLLAARQGFDAVLPTLRPGASIGKRVAVVGGGPAGMAAAYFLARQGAKVTLFEQRERLGGIVRYVIPRFRIADSGIDRDAKLLDAMGVEIRTNTVVPGVDALGNEYDAVILAVGAWKHGTVKLARGTGINVLDFLADCRSGKPQELGTDVVVIGGGNTAMDAARAAKRETGVVHSRIVYRRTARYMPADEEELRLAIDDGVEFCELLQPYSLENGELLCRQCVLGTPDASGRRSPVETDTIVRVPCTALILATGERVDDGFLSASGIETDERGHAKVSASLETSRPGVYVIGDGNRGPCTVVECIADARTVADAIVGPYAVTFPADAEAAAGECIQKQGILAEYADAGKELHRCLSCATVCENCVQVCPNRANAAIRVPGLSMPQILHIDRMCNECGNCTAFCPYSSAPYLEKFTLFSTEKEFGASANRGFLPLGDGRVKVRLDGKETVLPDDGHIDPTIEAFIETVLTEYAYLL